MRIRLQMTAVGVLVALFVGGAAQLARAQILDQVPGNALVVVKIKNIDQTNRKLARFIKRLGLDQMSPDWADPLSAVEKEAHIGKGVDRSGDLAFIYVDPASVGGDEEKAALFLVPTSNYKEFVANFKTAAEEGGITKATPEGGKDIYVAEWGKFAAISPGKEILAKKPTGIKLTGLAAKESDTKDAIAFANIPLLRDKALAEVAQGRDELLKNIGQAMPADKGVKFLPLVQVVIKQYMSIPETYLKDARSATLGLSIGDEGITATVASEFEPESYLGKIVSTVTNTADPLLSGLPDRKYFFFGGIAADPKLTQKFMTDFAKPIIAELAKLDETKSFAAAAEHFEKAASSSQGSSFGMVAPTGALGQESLIQQVVVLHGDAKALHQGETAMLSAVHDLFKLLPQTAGVATSFEVKPGAKTVDGVTLDSYSTKMDMSDDQPEAAQVKQMLATIYGPDGMGGVMGEASDKAFIMVSGGNDKLIADMIASAKTGAEPATLAATAKPVAAQLPKSRVMAGYLALDTIIDTSIRYAKGLGLPVNVKLQPALPPIGFTAGTEGSAVRVDIFVPTRLAEGIVAAGVEAQKQMKDPNGGL